MGLGLTTVARAFQSRPRGCGFEMAVAPTRVTRTVQRIPSGNDGCGKICISNEAGTNPPIICLLTVKFASDCVISRCMHHPSSRILTRPGIQFRCVDAVEAHRHSSNDDRVSISDFRDGSVDHVGAQRGRRDQQRYHNCTRKKFGSHESFPARNERRLEIQSAPRRTSGF